MFIWKEDGNIMNVSITGEAAPIGGLYSGHCLIADREATPEEVAQYEAEKSSKLIISEAILALDKTDTVALRCWKANIQFPTDWQTYTTALRAIVSGLDTTSVSLPAMPSYPVGT